MKTEDEELRRAIDKAICQVPENPYFKRKVMNRLPEKAAGGHGWILAIAYIIGAIALGCYWIEYLKQGVKINDPALYALWGATLAFTLSAVWSPLRRMLR